ncbi:thioredoxin-like protein [Mycena floridula]|nr:thioredoxin-like protein [Mycena floridula]
MTPSLEYKKAFREHDRSSPNSKMAALKTLTLYSAKICPFAQRVELALAEANAKFSRYEIDLKNKPEWYAPKVNPASKVPAVAYGGPSVSPDQPSPDSEKIAESLVLVEFVADLYPDSKLLPKDPVERAKARFFIDAFSTKFTPAFFATVARGESFDKGYEAIEALQSLLPKDKKFAVSDDFTIADAAVLPFFARMEVALSNDLGAFAEGEGRKIHERLNSDSKFARFKQYFLDLKARESFKATFDADYILKDYTTRYSELRAKIQA